MWTLQLHSGTGMAQFVCKGSQTILGASCTRKVIISKNDIDDLIGCDAPDIAVEAYEFLKSLIVNLGLVISERTNNRTTDM